MSNGNQITPFGDLGPAAKKLVEKISDGIGGLFRPRQIRRIAHAQADAAKTLAVADIEIDEMQRRAMQRMVIEQARDQSNIENVVRLALPHVKDDATPEKMDDDWLAAFFDQCRMVSNEEMQGLWARILAGEANHEGSFSKRTLRLVSDLDKNDAEMFTALCRFVWAIARVAQPLVFDLDDGIYKANGVTFGRLNHLDDIGLITFDNIAGFKRRNFGRELTISYCGRPFELQFPNAEGNDLSIGKVLLTQPGMQLASICEAPGIKELADYVTEFWQSKAPQIGIACLLPSGEQ